MTRTLPVLAAANFAAASAGMIIAGILQLIANDLNWSPAQAGRLITYCTVAFASVHRCSGRRWAPGAARKW